MRHMLSAMHQLLRVDAAADMIHVLRSELGASMVFLMSRLPRVLVVAASTLLELGNVAYAGSRAPSPIVLAGGGNNGAFDASLERDPATRTIWMSWSSVQLTPLGATPVNLVSTRLATSVDRGATWADQGLVVNDARPEPMPPPELAGRKTAWQHEVSRLVYDSGAPLAERWKLLWHRYLVADGIAGPGDGRFEHGWIGLRAAPSPGALAAAAERKLFSGAGYHLNPGITAYNEAVVGSPDVQLDQLAPSLADCLAFSEPGATATKQALYVSLLCATADPSAQRIILLRWPYPGGPWQYAGVALDAQDARNIDPEYNSLSASDLFSRGTAIYLVASPTRVADGSYDGCLVFRFAAVDEARLQDRNGDGRPVIRLSLSGDGASFNGACGYSRWGRRSGFVYGQFFPSAPNFRLFASGRW